MGLAITNLLESETISIEDLRNKTLAVDTHNILYQFLTTIRQRDGTPLTDSKGRVTSHLIGLFNRITRLMSYNIKFIFCFDGEMPELKKKETQRRKELKQEAASKYKEAAAKEDLKEMRKYAVRTSRLTQDMIKDAKQLIRALGQCIVDAPMEGEAQASYIVRKGDADYVLSQDADCFIYHAPKMVKNLTISGRRKKTSAHATKQIEPQVLKLDKTLSKLGINHEQLIILSILVGTDYNTGGIKGIGPKTALKLVKEHQDDYETIFRQAEWDKHFKVGWKEIYELIKNMKIKKDYELEWQEPDRERLLELLVEEHDFSRQRVENALDNIEKNQDKSQKGLGDYF